MFFFFFSFLNFVVVICNLHLLAAIGGLLADTPRIVNLFFLIIIFYFWSSWDKTNKNEYIEIVVFV